MGNRTERLLAIKGLISSEKISSQDELLHLLEERGLAYTQATLSRDLKFLKVNKISDPEKGYIYELPDQHVIINEVAENYASQGFTSLKFAQNLGIIKTLPGYAPGIASMIDRVNPFEIAATLAGDDTILIVPSDGVTEQDVMNSLVLIIPDLKEKLR
jgi:transcriptional regulator of arginine metabolism